MHYFPATKLHIFFHSTSFFSPNFATKKHIATQTPDMQHIAESTQTRPTSFRNPRPPCLTVPSEARFSPVGERKTPPSPHPKAPPREHPKARPAARQCRPPCSKFVQSGIVIASLQHRFPTIRRITTRERTYNDAALNGPSPCGEAVHGPAKCRQQSNNKHFNKTIRLPRRRSSCRLPDGRRARPPQVPFRTPRQVGINHLQRNG